jgi:prepilin-type N-terminal cleavage/methylation domain-containing protein/prepilin-type processing-associated H-X9-DG protein
VIVKTSPNLEIPRASACRSARERTRSAGLTLVELLVVIAIVAVLTVVVFTATVRVMASARQAAGVSIMQQLGVATAAFIQDNNNQMPGPISANGQLPNYTNRSAGTLFSQLSPYLGLEEKSQPTGLPDSLVCPAFRHRFPGWNANGRGNLGGNLGTPGGNGRVYFMNQDLVLKGKRVFGPQNDQQAQNQPNTMKYTVVSDGAPRTPIGKIVMLRDFEESIHGNNKRNFLFLDFHVEVLPSTHPLDPRPQ